MDLKYLTIVGHTQSSKINEEINYCFSSVNHHKTSVLFIVRNVTADQIQLYTRFENTKLPVKILNEFVTIQESVEFLESTGIIILLYNTSQLLKIKRILENYKGEYNLCIDEVEFLIKTKDLVTSNEILMDDLKKSAIHTLGATATPFMIFLNDNKPGVDNLHVKYITDTKIIYDSILKKDRAILLHTVTKLKKKQYCLFEELSNEYPNLTILV